MATWFYNAGRFQTLRRRVRPGLTLVELLVVLLILSILTVVAVQATEVIVDQGRFDATQSNLRQIEEAILGPLHQRQPDGSLLITGFVADVGRPPWAVGTDPKTQLAELWNNDKDANGIPDLLPLALRPAPSDGEVLIAGGWRPGGYLRLPLGTTELRDGWGNPFDLISAGPGTPITLVRSRGADNLDGGTAGYEIDTAVPLTPDRYTSALAGNVYVLDQFGARQNPTVAADETLVIRFYGPDAANPTGVSELMASLPGPRDSTMPAAYAFPLVTIGPRAVRAYLIKTGLPVPKNKSPIQRLMVQPGGQVLDLVMPHVP